MDVLYRLHDIHVTYGGRTALRVPHLEIHRGGIYALCGNNGSGKSTLLQVLALLRIADQGGLDYAGEAVYHSKRRVQDLRRQITLVEQSPYLFDRSVAQNLAFGLKIRGVHGYEQQQRIASALQAVGMDGFEKRSARELSGGEAQRVALARALALNPKVLLLDEPTSNIDRESLLVLEQLIPSLSRQGVTIVFSTHDALQSRRLKARVIRLNQGALAEEAEVEESSHFARECAL